MDNHITFRTAALADLPAIVELLANDELGRRREMTGPTLDARYLAAFNAIEADPNQQLAVAVDGANAVVGTLQLSFIPGIARTGAWRGQIEAVRIAEALRGSGVGHCAVQGARLHAGAIDHGQGPAGRAPLLRKTRLRREPRRLQAGSLSASEKLLSSAELTIVFRMFSKMSRKATASGGRAFQGESAV